MSNKRARPDGRDLQGGLPGKVAAQKGARRGLGPSPRKLPSSTPPEHQTKLLARLRAAEETLRAIQSGEVDALMVSGRRGEQVVSLKGGEPAYRMLVEAMSEGAATLSREWRCALLQSQVCRTDSASHLGRLLELRFSRWLRRQSKGDLKLCLPRLRRRLRKANSTCVA